MLHAPIQASNVRNCRSRPCRLSRCTQTARRLYAALSSLRGHRGPLPHRIAKARFVAFQNLVEATIRFVSTFRPRCNGWPQTIPRVARPKHQPSPPSGLFHAHHHAHQKTHRPLRWPVPCGPAIPTVRRLPATDRANPCPWGVDCATRV